MEPITRKLIAPCGMNCGVCRAHLRAKNRCPGCNADVTMRGCVQCLIRNCSERKGRYCFSCAVFPCARLKQLDKRYREKYAMSEIANLEYIRDNGINAFVEQQRKKYVSGKGVFCVHDKSVVSCAGTGKSQGAKK